jgi:hypothetical protein
VLRKTIPYGDYAGFTLVISYTGYSSNDTRLWLYSKSYFLDFCPIGWEGSGPEVEIFVEIF